MKNTHHRWENWRQYIALVGGMLVLALDAAAALPKGQLLIEADGGVEIFDLQNMAEAKENVVVQQGDLTLKCDVLQAWYQGQGSSGPSGKIERLKASGNVVFNTPGETAYGSEATYDMAPGLLTLIGAPPRLEISGKNGQPASVITAKKSFKYNKLKNHLWAQDVVLTQPEQRLEAGELDLFLKEDGKTASAGPSESTLADAGGQMRYAVVSKGVTVLTPAQVVTAEAGFYDGATQTIYLIDNVRIAHKEDAAERIQMRGAFAEIDRATGRSRLLTHLPATLDIPSELQALLPKPQAGPRQRVQILIIEAPDA